MNSSIDSSNQRKGRVLVAMSGGVDSSVAALLLQKQGYEVIGVTFQLYDYSRQNRKEGKGGCCSVEDVIDAKHVCHRLGIRHYLFDSRERFKQRVVDYFAESYKLGKTPNPCVACNTFIKFDELAFYADSVEADYFATGHYVRLTSENGKKYLERAVDPCKDQSYFLLGVTQNRLQRALFPCGDYEKDEIRRMAEEAGLPVSTKPDSMEVCFVPENNYRKFLKENYDFTDSPGDLIEVDTGKVLGRHPGIHHFTVGQKKILGSLGLHDYYVVRLDPETHQVFVGMDRKLLSEGMTFDPIYFEGVSDYFDREVTVKIRSRSDFLPAKILRSQNGEVVVRFNSPQRAVTPGQFAVFYQSNRLVGGGPILRPVADFSDVRAA